MVGGFSPPSEQARGAKRREVSTISPRQVPAVPYPKEDVDLGGGSRTGPTAGTVKVSRREIR